MSSPPQTESSDTQKLVDLMAVYLSHQIQKDIESKTRKSFKPDLSWFNSGDFYLLLAIAGIGAFFYFGKPVFEQAQQAKTNVDKATEKAGSIFYQGGKELKKGDRLPSGHIVTSGLGWRTHPVTGDRRFHNGVDLNTPSNTTLNAPFEGIATDVSNAACGKGIQFTALRFPFRIGMCHLNYFQTGRIKQGEIIAKTGNTGGSTGSHLHLTAHVCESPGYKQGKCPGNNWKLTTPTQELANLLFNPKPSNE